MRALEPEVFDTAVAAIKILLPVHAEIRPFGCHRPRIPDGDCFEVMPVSPGPAGRAASVSAGTRCPTPPSGPAVTSGSPPACSTPSSLRRSPSTTRSSASTSPRGQSTDRRTRAPLGVRDRQEPHRPGQARIEVVDPHRRQGRPLPLVHRRRQPQRLDPSRAHPRKRQRTGTARRHLDHLARPGSGLRRHPEATRRTRDPRRRHRQAAQARVHCSDQEAAHGAALAGPAHELMALEHRRRSTQHQPQDQASAGPVGPGGHLLAHRLAEPMVTRMGSYPLRVLALPPSPRRGDAWLQASPRAAHCTCRRAQDGLHRTATQGTGSRPGGMLRGGTAWTSSRSACGTAD